MEILGCYVLLHHESRLVFIITELPRGPSDSVAVNCMSHCVNVFDKVLLVCVRLKDI